MSYHDPVFGPGGRGKGEDTRDPLLGPGRKKRRRKKSIGFRGVFEGRGREGEGVPSVVYLTKFPTAPGHVPGLWCLRSCQAAVGTRAPRVLTECFDQRQGSRTTSSGTSAFATAAVFLLVPTETIQTTEGVGWEREGGKGRVGVCFCCPAAPHAR